ncbi:MAG: isochorismatase family protein [Paludibacteraceae bacterium]|nr:isochorismatase family protein [Paludibacteraceae bacterium]
MKKLLLIVDPQIDFISGSLPVGGADDAMKKLGEYIKQHDGDYMLKVVTTDWHPYHHCSFKAQGGPWPMHCVQNTVGAAISEHLVASLNETKGEVCVLRKGDNEAQEEYSIFKNSYSKIMLSQMIKEMDQIDVCGIAGDICVLNTLKDGIELFGKEKFNVLTEYCPSLDGGEALAKFVKELGK